jgi:hypothetical protein
MRFLKPTNIVLLGLTTMLFVVVSCGKKISPREAKQSRLEWNLKTLVGAYQDSGNTDPKWDEPVTNALIEFARTRSLSTGTDEDVATVIATNCEAAVKAGCDDPMVRYLYIKFVMSQTNSPKDFSDAFCKVEADMEQSAYPPIRKFYAALRAQQQLYYAFPTNYDRQLAFELAQRINDNLADTVNDKATPPEEVYDACHEGLYQMSGSDEWYTNCYNRIATPLFANWPKESVSWLVKGEAEVKMAWFARGGGYANTVNDEGWKLFREHLDKAENAFNHAWKLNSKDERIPFNMVQLELGQGKGRDRMELWFQRGMTLRTNYYDLCSRKLYYLAPKWYGSIDDMLEFGRECIQNTNWGGNVPLIMLDVHDSIGGMFTNKEDQANYWRQADVWSDIEAAYKRFFEVNPDATNRYYQYMWYADKCDQFGKILELIPTLTPPIDYDYFGGKDKFDKMVQTAKEHANKSSAASQK